MKRKSILHPDIPEPADSRMGSQCLQVGNQILISGQISYVNGELVGLGDPLEQCRQCFRNIDKFMTAAGGTIDGVIALDIYLNDIRYREASMQARTEFFNSPGPSVTVVGGLDFVFPEVLVEISARAMLS